MDNRRQICGQYGHILEPTFAVDDPDAENMGFYQHCGKTALARKHENDYTTVFSGLGNLSYQALRQIAGDARVHLYAEAGVPVYVNSRITGFYWHEPRRLHVLMREAGSYIDILSGREYITDDGNLEIDTAESGAICLVREELR